MSQLVSIITPAHNAKDFIHKTIQSVQWQTYANWEMIIVDDFSSDSTWEILTEIASKDERIRIFRLNKNKGAGYARNYALRRAKGVLVAFVDADDIWLPEKLDKQIYVMNKNDEAFVFSKYQLMSEDEIDIPQKINFPERVSYSDLLKSCSIGCLTVLIDTRKTGALRMPAISRTQDYALWLNVLRKGFTAYCVPEVLAKYRVRQNSISRNKLVKAKFQWFVYRKYEKLNLFKSSYYFVFYTIKGYFKNRKVI